MRRAIVIATAGLAALAAAASLAPSMLPGERAVAGLAAQIRETTGLELRSATGGASLHLLPRPALVLTGVEMRFPDGSPALTAREITATLRLRTLLSGGFAATSLRIEAPVLRATAPESRLALAEAGRRFVAGRLARDGGPAPTRIILSGATIVAGDEARSLVLTEGQARFDWGGGGEPLALSIAGRLRGQNVRASLSGLTPALVVARSRSPFDLKIDAPLLTLAVQGGLLMREEAEVDGSLALATPMLAELGAWLDVVAPLAPIIGPLALKGTGRITVSGFDLNQAEAKLGEDTLEGALSLRLAEGAPQISGTLATAQIDLTGLVALVGRHARAWRQPIAARGLGDYDIDLRLSATRAALGEMRLEDVALSAVMKRGRLEMTLGRALAGGGTVRGRLTAAASDRGLELKTNGTLTGVDLAAASKPFAWPVSLAGAATGSFAFDTSGGTPEQLVASLLGSAEISVETGEITGVDLSALAKRWADTRGVEAPPPRGRTSFATARFSATLWNGVAELKLAEIAGAAFRGALFGRVSLPTAELDLTGTLSPEPAAAQRQPGGFRLSGSWRHPTLGARPAPP